MPRKNPSPELLDRVFGKIVDAAIAGRRCPSNTELGGDLVPILCRQGRIASLVYAGNYRVVEIRQGLHAGKRTKEAPADRKPYLRVDTNGATPLGAYYQRRTGKVAP